MCFVSVSVDVYSKPIAPVVFVSGKGGVGKTLISQGLARSLARSGKKTLWICFEDPTRPPGEISTVEPLLDSLNCEAATAFDEYMGIKIGIPGLARLFVKNKLIQYLAQAAPGIHEIVLLGKVWHERTRYDHLVVDMPSTGYGLAMFQSVANFNRLFQSGPLQKDTQAMTQTFSDPMQTDHWILALPEEMPLQEALELGNFLQELFPKNPPSYWVNRVFPKIAPPSGDSWSDPQTPTAKDLVEFAIRRSLLEKENLKIWDQKGIVYQSIPYFIPTRRPLEESVCQYFSQSFSKTSKTRGYP